MDGCSIASQHHISVFVPIQYKSYLIGPEAIFLLLDQLWLCDLQTFTKGTRCAGWRVNSFFPSWASKRITVATPSTTSAIASASARWCTGWSISATSRWERPAVSVCVCVFVCVCVCMCVSRRFNSAKYAVLCTPFLFLFLHWPRSSACLS